MRPSHQQLEIKKTPTEMRHPRQAAAHAHTLAQVLAHATQPLRFPKKDTTKDETFTTSSGTRTHPCPSPCSCAPPAISKQSKHHTRLDNHHDTHTPSPTFLLTRFRFHRFRKINTKKHKQKNYSKLDARHRRQHASTPLPKSSLVRPTPQRFPTTKTPRTTRQPPVKKQHTHTHTHTHTRMRAQMPA